MEIVDIHSHILPGVDDGSQTVEQSLEMLRMAEREGITHMFATPHYKQGRYPADKGVLEQRLRALKEQAAENDIAVRLFLGTEILFHSGLEKKLAGGELCTMNRSGYLLTEFLPIEAFPYIKNAAEELLGIGYRPILAHVERVLCLSEDMERVRELKAMGCGIQVNSGSVAGDAGWKAGHFTRRLLKEELVDYLGTDAHDLKHRKPVMQKCASYLYKKCSRRYAEAVLFENARKNLLGAAADAVRQA